ncbi:serine-threonine phosophatase 2C [Babesia ovis]|uniref:Serine-threonine phosophatase 2C n=1 Tax=Babesia ovis TaxID=5869 RepID=A0A9W5WV46_BABOV|nr:serine-threonine phosophatase 2C [Babesia ovis]
MFVGHFAADTIQKIIVRHLISTEVWNVLMNEVNRDNGDGNAIPALAVLAMSQAYSNADTELLELCRKEKNHYSSCTGITVLMIKDYTVVAHVGDSRVSLCFEERGQVSARFITTDHKPDMPNEKRRIIASGGSVQYLPTHNNKPFLRGGDFLQRKSKGEQPMQIQYSRAFGGKDLKTYGLVCEPDITVFRRGKQHRAMIIASDGLWDTFESHQAFSKAFFARSKGENPSQSLVEYALRENKFTARRSDNITAIVIFFES